MFGRGVCEVESGRANNRGRGSRVFPWGFPVKGRNVSNDRTENALSSVHIVFLATATATATATCTAFVQCDTQNRETSART